MFMLENMCDSCQDISILKKERQNTGFDEYKDEYREYIRHAEVYRHRIC